MSVEQLIAAAVAAGLGDELAELRAEIRALRDAIAAPRPATRLTRAELAAAWKVSVRHVDNLRREGMPCVPIGESPRFVIADCEAWLRGRGEPLRVVTGGKRG